MNGYQGYVTSRPFMGARVPQHVQNIVIREYCNRMGYHYLLSGTEYAIPGSYLVLQSLIENLSNIDGIVAYSLMQMPLSAAHREIVFLEIIKRGRQIDFAVEGLSIKCESDIQRVENIWRISEVIRTQSNVQELI
jgi:sporadic carbohydrate cluster protein (TIGR04323 family)